MTCRPGNETVLSKEKTDQSPSRRYRQKRALSDARRRRGVLRSGYALPSSPRRRRTVILIVALQAAANRGKKGVPGKAAEAPSAKANQMKARCDGVEDVKAKLARSPKQGPPTATPSGDQTSPLPSTWRPRAGSKQALLISLLMSGEGASLAKIVAATNWLPHSPGGTDRIAQARLCDRAPTRLR